MGQPIINLKPCPRCGNKPSMMQFHNTSCNPDEPSSVFKVMCTKCGLGMESAFDNLFYATADWNKLCEQEEKRKSVEDKQAILDKFAETLKLTRNLKDLESLILEAETNSQYVVAKFKDRETKIDVTCDSGAAMLQDILKQIV